jgi:hypothetical protein
MVAELCMVREMVRQILTPNWNMKKYAREVVPKNLSENQKLTRRQVCSKLWSIIDLKFFRQKVSIREWQLKPSNDLKVLEGS